MPLTRCKCSSPSALLWEIANNQSSTCFEIHLTWKTGGRKRQGLGDGWDGRRKKISDRQVNCFSANFSFGDSLDAAILTGDQLPSRRSNVCGCPLEYSKGPQPSLFLPIRILMIIPRSPPASCNASLKSVIGIPIHLEAQRNEDRVTSRRTKEVRT